VDQKTIYFGYRARRDATRTAWAATSLDGAGRLIGFGAGAGCLKLLMGLDLVDPDFGIVIPSYREWVKDC